MSVVAILVLGAIIITGMSFRHENVSTRSVRKKELEDLREGIAQTRIEIDDMKEQLADIILRLE